MSDQEKIQAAVRLTDSAIRPGAGSLDVTPRYSVAGSGQALPGVDTDAEPILEPVAAHGATLCHNAGPHSPVHATDTSQCRVDRLGGNS
jgi:hypothetical protein